MIPGVPSMGGMELLIILAIVMLFFGAKRVPQLGRSLGQSMREFRKGASEDPNEAKLRERQEEDEELPAREEAHLIGSKEASAHSTEESSQAEQSTI